MNYLFYFSETARDSYDDDDVSIPCTDPMAVCVLFPTRTVPSSLVLLSANLRCVSHTFNEVGSSPMYVCMYGTHG